MSRPKSITRTIQGTGMGEIWGDVQSCRAGATVKLSWWSGNAINT